MDTDPHPTASPDELLSLGTSSWRGAYRWHIRVATPKCYAIGGLDIHRDVIKGVSQHYSILPLNLLKAKILNGLLFRLRLWWRNVTRWNTPRGSPLQFHLQLDYQKSTEGTMAPVTSFHCFLFLIRINIQKVCNHDRQNKPLVKSTKICLVFKSIKGKVKLSPIRTRTTRHISINNQWQTYISLLLVSLDFLPTISYT